jgi:hypothetical protein
MLRTLYVFQTDKGYLTEDCTTTKDPFKAINFVDFDSACKHLTAASGIYSGPVNIQSVQAQFPKPLDK